MNFLSFSKTATLIKILVFNQAPGSFPVLTYMPLVRNIAPGKSQTVAIGSSRRWPARLAGIRRLWRRFWRGKWAGRRASSPRVDPRAELGVGVRRQGCVVEPGSVGRGGLVFSERKGGARQHAAVWDSMWSRKELRVVGRRRTREEAEARRWRSNGGVAAARTRGGRLGGACARES
jgi:hypothetical protein